MNAQVNLDEKSLLPGVNILLEGPTGTGKTYSLGSLVDSDPNLEVFYLTLESGMESLFAYWTDRGKVVPPNLHWHALKGPDYSWDEMIRAAEVLNTLSSDALAKISDPGKSRHNQFIKFLKVLANFTDQRTGMSFEGVDTWGPNRVLIVDALTGLNTCVMSMIVGTKPVKSFVDWGAAMDQIERILRQLTEACRCHFVLIAHIDRETDQVLGGSKITVGTLGTKLAPKIPPMFSDVILSYREGTKFLWTTANSQADLKARNLPIADAIPQDFSKIIHKWLSRGGRISPTIQV